MSRHLTRERRIVYGILDALGHDATTFSPKELDELFRVAGMGMRDGFDDDYMEYIWHLDQKVRNGRT